MRFSKSEFDKEIDRKIRVEQMKRVYFNVCEFWDTYGYEMIVGLFFLIGIGIGIFGGWLMWGRF